MTIENKTGYFKLRFDKDDDVSIDNFYFHILSSEPILNGAGFRVKVKSCIQNQQYEFSYKNERFVRFSYAAYNRLEEITEKEYKIATYENYIENYVLSVAKKDKESSGQAFQLTALQILCRDTFLEEYGINCHDVMSGNSKLFSQLI
jgi:hypothetical protein